MSERSFPTQLLTFIYMEGVADIVGWLTQHIIIVPFSCLPLPETGAVQYLTSQPPLQRGSSCDSVK